MIEYRVSEEIIARLDALLSDVDDKAREYEYVTQQLRDVAQELKWAIEDLRKGEIEHE